MTSFVKPSGGGADVTAALSGEIVKITIKFSCGTAKFTVTVKAFQLTVNHSDYLKCTVKPSLDWET